MHVAGMLLGCLLLAPAPEANNARSSDIVAEAMQLPAGGAVAGQRLTLRDALGSTPDRRQQLKIVHAYWRLVQATAEYTFCRDHVKAIDRVKTNGQTDPSLRLAATVAAAQLRDAELRTVRAQYELAELARLPTTTSPPLPADAPLVVPYRTSFNELFTGKTPPDAARLCDKTLPIQRLAIDDRAAAVQAADDALAAVTENYQNRRGDPAAVVACSRELLRQQRTFIETVCAYNRNIADYALLVVAPTTTPQDLVSILIGPPKSATPPGGGAAAEQPVKATSGNEPIPGNPMRQPGRNEPTPAPKRSATEPTPGDRWKSAEPWTPPIPDTLKPADKNEPPLRPPESDPPRSAPDVITRPVVPIDTLPSAAPPRTARKPIRPPAPLGDLGGSAASGVPLYSALVAASPAARAKQLAVALYWDHSLPKDAGKPMSLADCLLRDGGGDHRATVEAYWLVRNRAARYEILAAQAELLNAIEPVALDRRNNPADMLRLQTAKLAAKATLRDSHVALIEAQYTLALRIGALADAAWPLASTVPHTGSYLLKFDAQPLSVKESWPARRLVATVPGLGQNVKERAAAVVDADAARVAVIDKYAAGGATIDQAIEGVTGQTEQTSAFLEAMAAYNRAIAEYATTVLPPGTPPQKLTAALVTKP